MGRRYTPSQCIIGFIVLSTLLTVICCIACAILLFLSPWEPEVWVYHGGDYTFYPSIGLIVAAITAVIFSFIGCCGACRDSKYALIVFSACSCVTIGLYLASSASMFAFAHKGEIRGQLNETLFEMMMNFSVSDGGNQEMGRLQECNECCGVTNYTDWETFQTPWYIHRHPDEIAPSSCCKSKGQDCAKNLTNIYTSKGCLQEVWSKLSITIDVVLGVTIVLAVVQVVTSCLSCYGSYLILKYEQYDIL